MTTILQPPELEHDKMMAAQFGTELRANDRRERRIVWNLLHALKAAGFTPYSIDDTEEDTRLDEAQDPLKQTMELLFNLDIAQVTFTNGIRLPWVQFVMGNDIDIISDYSYSSRAPGEFERVMESFDAEALG